MHVDRYHTPSSLAKGKVRAMHTPLICVAVALVTRGVGGDSGAGETCADEFSECYSSRCCKNAGMENENGNIIICLIVLDV